jgi:hypothetical protein
MQLITSFTACMSAAIFVSVVFDLISVLPDERAFTILPIGAVDYSSVMSPLWRALEDSPVQYPWLGPLMLIARMMWIAVVVYTIGQLTVKLRQSAEDAAQSTPANSGP